MPQQGFEEFTPSHNYKIMSDEAAFEMGALFAEVKRRKDAGDKKFGDIMKGSVQATGNEGTVLAKKGSPVNFLGAAGLAAGMAGSNPLSNGGAIAGMLGGNSNLANILGAFGVGNNNGADNNNSDTNVIATRSAFSKRHNVEHERMNEGDSGSEQIESVINQDQVAPTGNQIEKAPTALDTAQALNTSDATLNRTNSLYGTADERGLPAMSSPDEYANVLKPQVV